MLVTARLVIVVVPAESVDVNEAASSTVSVEYNLVAPVTWKVEEAERRPVTVRLEAKVEEAVEINPANVERPDMFNVPVAVILAAERFPETSAFPWTDNFAAGVVVPIPTLPPVVARYAELVVVSCVVDAFANVVSPVTLKVPVAVRFASVRSPEKKEFPWTAKSCD